MIKYFFAFLLLVHGSIHTIGFSKAFGIGNIQQLKKEISRKSGLIWLSTAILFFVAAVTYLLKIECWWMFGLIATIISQILITVNWQDAKFGTISNLIILPAVLIGYFSWNFKHSFHQDVDANLINSIMETKMITDADLNAIPEAVKRYLKYT
ncbi:MAG TPA: hypothetical protein PKD91_13425, partial [Bacteroidia bacterium]|nr:hypothetical protein [Bacteroidia bacterium]